MILNEEVEKVGNRIIDLKRKELFLEDYDLLCIKYNEMRRRLVFEGKWEQYCKVKRYKVDHYAEDLI